MRLLRYALAVWVGAAGLTAAISLTGTPAASAATGAGVCPQIPAPVPWQLPYSPYTTGTKYDVQVHGYSCAKADGYIRKLVTHSVSHGYPALVSGGPHGWRCTGSRSKRGLAYTGMCTKSLGFSGPWFSWTVG
jgi:hypothetical protein